MAVPLCCPVRTGSLGRPNRRAARLRPCVLAGLLCIGAVLRTHADDRPFLRTTHALASDSDDAWEVSTMAVANRHGWALSSQIERDLSATQKLEIEFGHSPNALGPEAEQGLRLRSLWVSPANAGWGWATKLGIEPRRAGDDTGRRTQAQSVFSWSPAEGSWLHLNLGWQWRQLAEGGQQRSGTYALALQHAGSAQRGWYAETAGTSDGRDRLLHMGLRHWLQAHKLALDTGIGRQAGSERSGPFITINLNFFDLDI